MSLQEIFIFNSQSSPQFYDGKTFYTENAPHVLKTKEEEFLIEVRYEIIPKTTGTFDFLLVIA